MKFYFWLILCSFFYLTAQGQRICGTLSSLPSSGANSGIYLRELPPNAPPRDTSANEIITIPVVVHVIFNNSVQLISDARVKAQIDALNRDFRMMNADRALIPDAFKSRAADARIMFCLAQVDPEGRPTSGIVKRYTTAAPFKTAEAMKFDASGGSNAWDTRNYLNIWVCSLFGRILGFSSLPGADAATDGVVISHDVFGNGSGLRAHFDMGRTATHEIAHWLGLKHIWGDAECGDDGIADTPPQLTYNYGCPTFPRMSTCTANADGEMFMNFMDLTNDACMYMFTKGQVNKMRAQFALGGVRNSLLRSYRCDSSFASGAPLPQDTLPKAIKPVSITVYPNPARNEVNIRYSATQHTQGRKAILYAASSIPLASFALKGSTAFINVSALPSGVYVLKVETDTGIISTKLIKQ